MGRYDVFVYATHYPSGGWKDCNGIEPTLDDAILNHYSLAKLWDVSSWAFDSDIEMLSEEDVQYISKYDYLGEIVDLDTLEVVWEAPYAS